MKRPTIYSIAKACGVSASTVSRAFSRPHAVNVELRERIHALAREVGYQPNKAARGLVTGRTGMIGLLVPDITNPFFPPLVRAIQQAAAAVDSSVLLVDAEESAAAEPQLIRHLAGQVDGLLLASPRSSALKDRTNGPPAVVINRRIRGVPAVICDNTRALQAAGRHLEQLGHRMVALMRGPSASWAARQRADAIHAWAAARSDVTLVDLGPFAASFDGGLAAATALMKTKCTAAFAFDDLMACGVLAGLADAGVRVPDECSVIGCDDVLLARTVTPALTTVTAPVQRLGHAAVELLQRCGSGEPTDEIRVDGELTIRASTGPAA